jgi:tetratricopeptide (TPR) repeat protein
MTLGRKLFERKEYAEAARYLAYLGENASPDYLMMYSEACFNSGKFKDAARVLESVKSGNKIKGTILYQIYKMLAEAYEKDSNYIKASKAYGDYLTLPGVKILMLHINRLFIWNAVMWRLHRNSMSRISKTILLIIAVFCGLV